MYSVFAIELSELSKPFKFARLKGFERLGNCLTKGTYERWNNSLNKHIVLPFKSFLKGIERCGSAAAENEGVF